MNSHRKPKLDNTRKHFLPQFYLRGFCPTDSPGRIYMYDKQNPDKGVILCSVRDAAVSRHAYSVANDLVLQKRENQWARILEKLKEYSVVELNTFISDRNRSAVFRSWIARFVVDSRLRSQGMRSSLRGKLETIRYRYQAEFDRYVESLKSSRPSRTSGILSPDSTDVQEVIAAMAEETGLFDQRRFEALYLDPFLRGEEGEEEYNLHAEGRWRFETAPSGRSFITSDLPSISFPSSRDSNRMIFTMALSCDLQLIGICGDTRIEDGLAILADIDDRRMNSTNESVFQIAERFVYASAEDEITRAARLQDK